MEFRKYLRDIASSGIPTLLVKLRGLLILPFLLHTVGLAGYGAWLQVVSSTNLLALLASLGLHSAVIRFHPEEAGREGRSRLLYSALALSLAVAVVLAAGYGATAAPLSRLLLKDGEYAPLFALGALLIPLSVARLLLVSHFRAQDRIRWVAGAESAYGAAEVALLLGAAVLSRATFPVLAASVAALGAYVLFLFATAVREGYTPAAGLAPVTPYLRYSVPLIPTLAADEVLSRGDRLIVGMFLGADSVGLYSAIYALASVPMLFSTPVTHALLPKVVGCWSRGDQAGAARYVGVTVQGMVVATAGTGALLLFLGDPLLRLLGAARSGFLPTGLLVLAGVGAYALARVYSVLFVARKRTGTFSAAWTACGVVNVALNLALVP
ncbi:MAG TPA: lipopolysaccharide biosynthesis protein, partial [Longimicrobiaceae bacterium]|nr:lipopolysaccharide biosynthesis protein [Longimicrobiaceae bacterium]